MAKFLTTLDAISEIEKIINNAKSILVMICPFVKIPENLFQNLKVASRKVKITLVYGKAEMKSEERNRLAQLENLSLSFLDNLHAKCFFNEDAMVITSFNMLVSSMENKEMGVLITVKDDPNCFNEAFKEAKRIVSSATKDTLRETKKKGYSYETKVAGYCIRCGAHIDFDLERPLCYDHFLEWNEWQNPDYPEHFCHTCGKESITTMVRPQCDSCYRKSKTGS